MIVFNEVTRTYKGHEYNAYIDWKREQSWAFHVGYRSPTLPAALHRHDMLREDLLERLKP